MDLKEQVCVLHRDLVRARKPISGV
jgi:hypothetical protein